MRCTDARNGCARESSENVIVILYTSGMYEWIIGGIAGEAAARIFRPCTLVC